jgi:deoxyribodipyrimidine photo-lyase
LTRIVWHRGDLRTHDHPALHGAVHAGPTIGLVILDNRILCATSARRRAWFYANVKALRASYRARGGTLYVRAGDPADVLPAFISEIDNGARVHALRSCSPYGRARDAHADTITRIQWHDGLYVHAPGSITTKAGGPYTVYSPYRNAWRSQPFGEPLESPERITSPEINADIGDVPDESCDIALPPAGEDCALTSLRSFLERGVQHYADARDLLDGSGSSRLSPFITIGVLSPRVIADAAMHRNGAGAAKWIDELIWRDFLADVLYHRPELVSEPFHPRWSAFEWNDSESHFDAWHNGTTGIPAVDAAMRELNATGWISNRARMIAAQFLTKHLRIHWTKGAAAFHALLLDGDVASNVGNWQWAAGLGIDNAPYFRVFNPVTQARQHDPDSAWLRRWVPECDGRPDPMPNAIINLAQARRDYLDAASATATTAQTSMTEHDRA